jgi:MFS superfamily sulfate permease-like transporter
VRRALPFLGWIHEVRNRETLRADAIAGLTVALVLIPQSMAYAQLAGLPPYYGLYASFLPVVIAALFGSSRQLATGPVAMVSLLTSAALSPLAAAGSPGYIAYAILLALIVGLFQLGLGLLRMGMLVNFIAHPVIVGFSNAAAIIIATSQLDKIFGVQAIRAEHHYETVWNIVVAAADYIHWPTFGVAVLAFGIMFLLKRRYPMVPNVLVAVVITTALAWGLKFEKLHDAQPEQFAGAAETLVGDVVLASSTLVEARSEASAVETIVADNMARYGANDRRTVASVRRLETARERVEKLEKTLKTNVEQLKRARFDAVRVNDSLQFYITGQVPEDASSTGSAWRMRSIDDDGTLHLNGGGSVVGKVPEGLPAIALPKFDFSAVLTLLSAAITITLIGFMEAISIAKSMAARTRQRLDPNQELIGQGLANMVGSLAQSYPVSGSFSRSAVNLSAGAITGFSSVVTGLVVVIALLWFTPLLYHLPQATLAAVIMMAVVGLINIEGFKHAWHAHKHDGIVAIATFALTLAFAPHLDKGIMIGAGLALGLYLYRSMEPRVAILARHPDGTLRDADLFGLETCKEITMIRYDGSLYFANTSYFEDRLLERVAAKPDLKYVIVVGDGINEIDASGEDVLASLTNRLHDGGVEVLFSGLKKQVVDVLKRTHLYEKLGEDRFFRTEEHALNHVWEKLGNGHEVDCPLNIVCPVQRSA